MTIATTSSTARQSVLKHVPELALALAGIALVLLALGPADKAGAHYHLASAYQALSDSDNAKLEVLAALEIASGYRPAQRLLLELNGK